MYPLNISNNLSAQVQENIKVNEGTLRFKGLQAAYIISLFLYLLSSTQALAFADLGNIKASNNSQEHSVDAEISQEQAPLTKAEILNLIKEAEIKYHIPRHLLKSIARIESGHNQYYLNVSGKTFKTKSAISALSIINQEIAKGNNNIDIGVMQLNLRWHGSKFKDLKEMLDPIANIEYGAKHLSILKKEYGNWHKAVRIYHSSNPEYYTKYSRKVLLSWLQEK